MVLLKEWKLKANSYLYVNQLDSLPAGMRAANNNDCHDLRTDSSAAIRTAYRGAGYESR